MPPAFTAHGAGCDGVIQILLVEDEASLGETLQERLEREGYKVCWATTAAQALAQWKSERFDLVVLDVGLPDGSGFDIAEQLDRRVPVIFMTALNSAENRLRGYDVGAEEFIPKPFHLRELLMRVRHVLDNHRPVLKISVKGFEIDLDSYTIRSPKNSVERMQKRDAELLKLLIEKSPNVVSRDDILDRVWGEDKFPSLRTVDNAIVRLRALLDDAGGELIQSVRGVGYQWMGGRQ